MAHQHDPESKPPIPADAPSLPEGGAGSTCDWVSALLGEYAAGTLPQLDRVGVDNHLSLCATCRKTADEYLEVIRLAGSLPDVRPSPEAEARLRRFIGRMTGGTGQQGGDGAPGKG